jgi:predicted phosphate transport protein (TIGR00153 family)
MIIGGTALARSVPCTSLDEEPLVRIRLTPGNSRFQELFTASAGNLVSGATLLQKLAHAAPPERIMLAEDLKRVEEAGDEATHVIMNEVNTSFITPFDREDIYRLASCLDDVMDAMEEAGALVVLYRVEELPSGALEQVRILSAAAALTADAMPRLSRVRGLAPYWIEINRLENEADQIYRQLLRELFSPPVRDPVATFKLKEIIDQLEEGADAFEKVAHTVESIAVKES